MACKTNFATRARNRIDIQEQVVTPSDYGDSVKAWQTLSNVWAIIEPVRGRERYRFEKVESQVTHNMTIRYIKDLKSTAIASKYRVSFDERFFDIQYIYNLDDDMKTEGQHEH